MNDNQRFTQPNNPNSPNNPNNPGMQTPAQGQSPGFTPQPQGFTPQSLRNEPINRDPFARPAPSQRQANADFAARHRNPNLKPSPDLGEVSDLPDTSEEDARRISGMIPQEATSDAGIEGMLGLMKEALTGEPAQPGEIRSAQERVFAPRSTEDALANPLTGLDSVAMEKANVSAGDNGNRSYPLYIPDSPAQQSAQPAAQQATQRESAPVPGAVPFSGVGNSGASESKPVDKPAEPEFKDEEILPLLDSLLLRGYASETFSLRSCSVTLRSQFFWEDAMAVTLTEEAITPQMLRDTVSMLMQLNLLAMNLESFGGVRFKVIRRGTQDELRKSMEERVEFLNTLPTGIVLYLWGCREKFILKMDFLMKNFDRLIKVF